ncbi:MAG: hydrogenase maturation nickel metallochaperone HypA [Candidatus Saliniplasma sp.]
MHEYSVMKQLVSALLDELKDKDVKKVKEVRVEIGELTFLGEQQLNFAFEVLSKDSILEGSELKVKMKDAEVRCNQCGYEGGVSYSNDPGFHFNIPVISCPDCGEKPKVIQGKETMITGVTAEEVD